MGMGDELMSRLRRKLSITLSFEDAEMGEVLIRGIKYDHLWDPHRHQDSLHCSTKNRLKSHLMLGMTPDPRARKRGDV